MKYHLTILCLIASVFSQIWAQGLSSYNKWTPYISHKETSGIVFKDPHFYVTTVSGIFTLNRETGEQRTYSMIDGLSSLNPTAIYHDESSDNILLGYANGMIDMFHDVHELGYISDIKNSSLFTSKRINQFLTYGEDLLIATDFGIVRYNVQRGEVKDFSSKVQDLASGLPVLAMALSNDTLWVAMGAYGIYYKPLLSSQLPDPESWVLESGTNGLPILPGYDMAANEGDIFALVRDSVYQRQGTSWARAAIPDKVYTSLNSGSGMLFAHTSSRIVVMDKIADTTFTIFTWGSPNDVIPLDDHFWISDRAKGMLEYEPETVISTNWTPAGPGNNNVTQIIAGKGEFYVAPKGRNNTGCFWERWGVYYYNQEKGWTSISLQSGILGDDINRAFHTGYYDPLTDYAYVGSCGQGIVVLQDDDTVATYTPFNSEMVGLTESEFRISGLSPDRHGNMWATSVISEANRTLSVLTTEGEWHAFQIPEAFPAQLLVDDHDNQWMMDKNTGIYVFNANGTFSDPLDDRIRLMSTFVGGGNLPNFKVNDLCKDHEGKIWVATSNGVAVFNNPEVIWDETAGELADAQCPEVNGSCLLNETVVTAIATDAENRKWIGTAESGVWQVSADGTEILKHFNTENSELLSDKIIDVAVDLETGEVYFGTESGVMGYIENFEKTKENSKVVHAFPVPYLIEKGSGLTIRWLAADSKVHIRDLSGRLLAEVKPNSTGEALWDGTSAIGNRVLSGFYIVQVLNAEGVITGYRKIIVADH